MMQRNLHIAKSLLIITWFIFTLFDAFNFWALEEFVDGDSAVGQDDGQVDHDDVVVVQHIDREYFSQKSFYWFDGALVNTTLDGGLEVKVLMNY